MTMNMRRAVAATIAVVTIAMLYIWALIGSDLLTRYIFYHLTPNMPLSAVGGPVRNVRPTVFYLFCGGLLSVSGVAASLLVLIPRPGFRTRGIVYLLFLAIILPASAYNYDQFDAVMRAPLQVVLNLVLIFLAATVSQWISSAVPTSPDVRVLKYLGLFLLLTNWRDRASTVYKALRIVGVAHARS